MMKYDIHNVQMEQWHGRRPITPRINSLCISFDENFRSCLRMLDYVSLRDRN